MKQLDNLKYIGCYESLADYQAEFEATSVDNFEEEDYIALASTFGTHIYLKG